MNYGFHLHKSLENQSDYEDRAIMDRLVYDNYIKVSVNSPVCWCWKCLDKHRVNSSAVGKFVPALIVMNERVSKCKRFEFYPNKLPSCQCREIKITHWHWVIWYFCLDFDNVKSKKRKDRWRGVTWQSLPARNKISCIPCLASIYPFLLTPISHNFNTSWWF